MSYEYDRVEVPDVASRLVRGAVEEPISAGTVTDDLARLRRDVEKVATSEFADEIVATTETPA